MTTELTIYDRFQHPGQFIEQLGKAICLSEMFGCTNASQGQVLALECASRRCPPMSLAERYHIIFGKLSMKTDAMLADFRTKYGGSHRVLSRTADKASVELSINDQTQVFTLTWAEAVQEPFVYVGKDQAIIEKLEKNKYDLLMLKAKYATPRSRMQMLWARVVSDGVRTMAPEVVAGFYTPEEIGDYAEYEDGEAGPAQTENASWTVQAEAASIDPTVQAEAASIDPTVQAEAASVDPAQPVEPARTKQTKPGVKLSGKTKSSAKDTAYSESVNAPCGQEMATKIAGLVQDLQIPVEKIESIKAHFGATKLADLPRVEAEKLLARLEARRSEAADEIPF